jgi:radical SAM protein with 4Fe4S-binding SPASM domain
VECPSSPTLTLGELGDTLLRQLGHRRYPLGGTLELTERCNLACQMCYINQPANSREAAARELTLSQIKEILDQLSNAGCLSLLLTGGEVLLRPDFPDIWRYAKRKGLLLTLFTNGTLLTPRIADFLAEWRPTTMEITLYGATQETYEQVTQVPGSYARCVRGIELALERGLSLNLKSLVVQANRHEIDAMQQMATAFGVPYRFDGVLLPRLNGGGMAPDQRLSPAQLVALDSEYPERQEEYDRLCRDFAGAVVRDEYVYTCLAGQRSFYIDSTGGMLLCMMARRPRYELLQGSFQEGWEFLGTVLGKKRTKDTACRSCSAGVLCAQCPGWSQWVHGDDETPVDYVCQIGRLRAARALTCPGSSTGAERVAELALVRREPLAFKPSEEPTTSIRSRPLFEA